MIKTSKTERDVMYNTRMRLTYSDKRIITEHKVDLIKAKYIEREKSPNFDSDNSTITDEIVISKEKKILEQKELALLPDFAHNTARILGLNETIELRERKYQRDLNFNKALNKAMRVDEAMRYVDKKDKMRFYS
jgi:hypothetical protein